jgi:hypothetical protein
MTPEEIEQIIQGAPLQLQERMGELESAIKDAAKEALSASQDSEAGGKPSVSINLKVKINLAKSPVSYKTSGNVSVAYKSDGEEIECDDPHQPRLL